MSKWHDSLKNRVALAFFFLAVLVLTATGYGTFLYYGAEYLATVSGQQFTLISQLSAQLDQQLAFGRELVTRAAKRLEPALLDDPDRLQAFLDNQLDGGTQLFFDNGIFVFSPNGVLIAEWPYKPDRRGHDYSYRDYFRQTVASGQPIISDPYFSSQTHHHPAISFTAPIVDAAGRLAGVIAGSLDLRSDNFLHGLGHVPIGRSGYLYLFNQNRVMILHPDNALILKSDVAPGTDLLFDQAINGFEGTGETVNYRGVETLASFKHLAQANWILAASYPAREAFAPLERARYNALAGLLVLLLASGVVIWLVTRRVTRPLLLLTEYVRDVDPTHSVHQLGISLKGEIGILAQTFEEMKRENFRQQALAGEQLNFLQTIIDTIPHPVYYQGPDGRITGCNASFALVVDMSSEEILGKPLQELLQLTNTATSGCRDEDLLPHGDQVVCSYEEHLSIGTGDERDFLLYKAIFRDSRDKPAGLVGTLVDITEHKTMEAALLVQKRFFESLLQNSAVACFVLDPRHKVLIWTKACEELTGISAEEMVGTDLHWRAFYPAPRPCLADLVIDNALEQTIDLYEQYAASRLIPEGIQAEGWYPDVGGRQRYLFFEAAPIRDPDGQVIAAIETLQDLASLKYAERSLIESEQSHRSLIERLPDAIVVHRGGTVLFVNLAAARLFGASSPEQLKNCEIASLIQSDFREDFLKQIDIVGTSLIDQAYAEGRILRVDSQELEVESSSAPVFYGGAWSVQTILRDITRRKEQQEVVWRQANYDALTQIPNRMLFNDRLRQAVELSLREQKPCGVMYIDLDGFKAINDTLGHDAGDVLLREVAGRLTGTMRKSDTVARLGGDEFAVVIPNLIEPMNAGLIARRILAELARPFQLAGAPRKISGSIGVAMFPGDAGDTQALIKCADSAMYRAKQGGKNAFCLFAKDEVESFGGREG